MAHACRLPVPLSQAGRRPDLGHHGAVLPVPNRLSHTTLQFGRLSAWAGGWGLAFSVAVVSLLGWAPGCLSAVGRHVGGFRGGAVVKAAFGGSERVRAPPGDPRWALLGVHSEVRGQRRVACVSPT